MEVEQLLGLDVGLKRTGIARASTAARMAEPLLTVHTTEIFKTLRELIKEYDVDMIVVGLPRGLAGHDTKQTTWVREWVDHAKGKIDLPFYWQDEALTSHLAEAERAAHKRPHDIDSLAAAIILQDFLESPTTNRELC